MSQDISRTSSQDTEESIVLARQIIYMKEVPAPQLKAPVKTALHQAVTDGRIHQARLLTSHADNIDTKDVNGWTPLMLNCNAKKDKIGRKMLNMFLEKGVLFTKKELNLGYISADFYTGAKVNYKDKMGRTALMIACLSSNARVVRRLLAEDSLDMYIKDNDGNTALVHAAMKYDPNILNMMLERVLSLQLDVDARNNLGYTALLYSCKLGHFHNALTLLMVGKACPYIRDMEHRYCAKDWINWFRYKQFQRQNERKRFPHLLKRHSTKNIEELSEQQSIKKLLDKIYKPTMLKPIPYARSHSLPADVNHVTVSQEMSDEQLKNMHQLKNELNMLEEEHEAERERIYLLQTGRIAKRRPRDISTAKLRRVSGMDSRKHCLPITLPHIFTLYALNYQQKCVTDDNSSMTDLTAKINCEVYGGDNYTAE